jgi:hypothetical protein
MRRSRKLSPGTVLTSMAFLANVAGCQSSEGPRSSVVLPASVATPSAAPTVVPTVAAPIPIAPEKSNPQTTAETPRSPVPRPRNTRCVRPIAEFCRGEPCPTRGEREKELRSRIGQYKATSSGCPRVATLGRCGRLYVVEEADTYTSATAYFDETGRLVAAERTSDTNSFCQGSFGARYGDIPACTPSVTEDLCAGVTRRDDGL